MKPAFFSFFVTASLQAVPLDMRVRVLRRAASLAMSSRLAFKRALSAGLASSMKALNSSTTDATLSASRLSAKPSVCASSKAFARAISSCSAIQVSYCVWSVCVRRERVLPRNMFVKKLPLAKRTFTLPSANLTLNVLPLVVLPMTVIFPSTGASPSRKWFANETSAI